MPDSRERIIVGVDGSDDSKQALRWAVAQASRTGHDVVAVAAWEVPLRILVLPTATEQDYADHAATILEETLRDVLSDAPSVPVHAEVVEGRPARVLTRVATSQDTLVVGSHGRGRTPRDAPGIDGGVLRSPRALPRRRAPRGSCMTG